MEAGHPLQIHQVIPFGLSVDEALIIALGAGIFLVVWSIAGYLLERDRFAPRLRMIQERRAALKQEALAATPRRAREQAVHLGFIRRVVIQLRLLQEHQSGALQRRLTAAGYRSKDALVLFAFAKLAAPLAGLGVGALLSGMDWGDPFSLGQLQAWFILLAVGTAFTRLPELLVANARNKRQQAIRRALPDALDLMMICAEAGLSLAAALDRVSRELGRMSPILAEELSLTSVELGFLPERAMALRNLAERTEIQEMRGFVNVITQTEKYGTPIAQALRVLSREFRTQRMLRAEQKAARLPALMTVPMIVFILPALFIVVMAPAIIGVMGVM